MTEIHIPYPPSANKLWRRAGLRIHPSSVYDRWLKAAGHYVNAQRPAGIVGKYKLIIQAARPDNRRRDLDNLIKPISDLLAHVGVIGNDCDCEMISARWVTTGEGVMVRVEPAGVE